MNIWLARNTNKIFYVGVIILILTPFLIHVHPPEYFKDPNDLQSKDFRYQQLIKDNISETIIAQTLQYRQSLFRSFTPYITEQNSSCINRSIYRFEHARLFGLDPYFDDFQKERILVIGDKTALGAALVRVLKERNMSYISVGCQHNLDLSSPDAMELFEMVKIKKAIFCCNLEIPRNLHRDSFKHYASVHHYIVKRTSGYFKNHSIPFIAAVEEIMPQKQADIILKSGGKIIVFPQLRSENSLYQRSQEECTKTGHTTYEYIKNELSKLDPITAAKFVLDSQPNSPDKILVKSDSEPISFENCKADIKPIPHKLPELQDYKSHFLSPSSYTPTPRNRSSAYLSIVFVGRHDNFSSGFEERTHNSLKSIARGLEMNPLCSLEIVFVDYATQENITKLHEHLTIPPALQGKVRFVIVPPKTHQFLNQKFNSKMAFFEYIAKNIGIRRSKGDFILVTNPDNLFPSTFFDLLEREEFNKFIVYRAKRFDTRNTTLANYGADRLMEMIDTPFEGLPEDVYDRCHLPKQRFTLFDSVQKLRDLVFPCGSGDFLMMSREMWEAVGGFNELPANPNVDAVFNARVMKLIPGYAKQIINPIILHQWHPRKNFKRPAIMDHTEVMDEYACQGISNKLAKYKDDFHWGLSNYKFEEVTK